MDSTGQSAIEYLFLIGGAILIAAIVIAVLTGVGTLGKTQSNNAYGKIEKIQLCLQKSDCPASQNCINGQCA